MAPKSSQCPLNPTLKCFFNFKDLILVELGGSSNIDSVDTNPAIDTSVIEWILLFPLCSPLNCDKQIMVLEMKK